MGLGEIAWGLRAGSACVCLGPTYSGVMERGVRVMGRPDSPLNTQLPGDCCREGRSPREGTVASLCGNGQRAEGPASRDPSEPGTQEHHRSQAAGSELGRAEDPGLPGLSWLSCHWAWGGKEFSTLVPEVHRVSERQGSVAGPSYGMRGWGLPREKGRYLQTTICISEAESGEIVYPPYQGTHRIAYDPTSPPTRCGGAPDFPAG